MCGICGTYSLSNEKQNSYEVESMMKFMNHRGPDDKGIFLYSNVALGFVRLSILDLSKSGNQPMLDATGRYSLVFNGEIYNYIELKNELSKKGYTFRTKTDTEVLLYSYIEWGNKCLDKFNGMFAFAIFDKQQSTLFIARDRYGIKPFYYTVLNEKFIFSSEILPLTKTFSQIRKINEEAVYNYLLYNRTDYDNSTFFHDIFRLPHGCYAIINNKINIFRWYDLKQHIEKSNGFESYEEYYELLKSSIGLRLRSDVPIGVCLSGGLDSSSIASILIDEYNKSEINSFSAVYSDDYVDNEEKYIKLFQSRLSNMSYIKPNAESLLNDINDYINAQEEPVPTTNPYAQYKVMELAKDYVKVTLDGQGADEQLAGYHYFFGFYFKELIKNLRLWMFLTESGSYVIKHRSFYGIKSLVYLMLPSYLKSRLRKFEKSYLSDDFYDKHKHMMIIPDELYSSDSLKKSLLDHFKMKLEHLLKWEDRNSMHFSIEARLPFMDYRIVHKTLSTDSTFIINKGMTKYILRQALSALLPEEIRNRRDKVGFATPSDEWFRENKFKEYIIDMISSSSFKSRGFLKHDKVETLYSNHMKGKINIGKDIWKWLNLETWIKNCVEKSDS